MLAQSAAASLLSSNVFAATVSQASFTSQTNDAISEDNTVNWAATEETYDLDKGGGAQTEVGTVKVGMSKGDAGNVVEDDEVAAMMAAIGGAKILPAPPAGDIRG